MINAYVNRDAVIDALCQEACKVNFSDCRFRCPKGNGKDWEEHCPGINIIKKFPSIQFTADGDTIDRQAAIDALKSLSFSHYFELGEYIGQETVEIQIINAERAFDTLESLPSAQPEIIRCKDCTRCEIDTMANEYWCDGREVHADHYCGYAERRTDEDD